jgi:hypothetical protein
MSSSEPSNVREPVARPVSDGAISPVGFNLHLRSALGPGRHLRGRCRCGRSGPVDPGCLGVARVEGSSPERSGGASEVSLQSPGGLPRNRHRPGAPWRDVLLPTVTRWRDEDGPEQATTNDCGTMGFTSRSPVTPANGPLGSRPRKRANSSVGTRRSPWRGSYSFALGAERRAATTSTCAQTAWT